KVVSPERRGEGSERSLDANKCGAIARIFRPSPTSLRIRRRRVAGPSAHGTCDTFERRDRLLPQPHAFEGVGAVQKARLLLAELGLGPPQVLADSAVSRAPVPVHVGLTGVTSPCPARTKRKHVVEAGDLEQALDILRPEGHGELASGTWQ